MRLSVLVYCDHKGEFRWRMRRGGRIVADSGEGYTTPYGARRAVNRLIQAFGAPPLEWSRLGTARMWYGERAQAPS